MEVVVKKLRRKKKELDEAIWNALEKLIVEHGFNDITLVKLAQEAGVEPQVIYNRFEDIDELLEKYVRKYDYWLNDIFKFQAGNTAGENCKKLFIDLINELYDNEIMQRILLWELNDTHRVTRRMALSREVDSSELIQYYNNSLDNFNGVSSVVIAGIYYLILHRRISTFSTINFNTPQGRQNLTETVEIIADKLFAENIPAVHDKISDIAKKLLEEGVDKNIITKSTGLSIEEINKL